MSAANQDRYRYRCSFAQVDADSCTIAVVALPPHFDIRGHQHVVGGQQSAVTKSERAVLGRLPHATAADDMHTRDVHRASSFGRPRLLMRDEDYSAGVIAACPDCSQQPGSDVVTGRVDVDGRSAGRCIEHDAGDCAGNSYHRKDNGAMSPPPRPPAYRGRRPRRPEVCGETQRHLTDRLRVGHTERRGPAARELHRNAIGSSAAA